MDITREQIARFNRKVRMNGDGCLIWTGPTGKGGYGRFQPDEKNSSVKVQAHRWIYEVVKGPIPDGHQLDHVCHTLAVAEGRCSGSQCQHRLCCNPEHLEAVTAGENTFRQDHANRRKTHCPAGHEYDDENTYVRNGARVCRACDRARKAKGAT